jgi:hypothetical protein
MLHKEEITLIHNKKRVNALRDKQIQHSCWSVELACVPNLLSKVFVLVRIQKRS